MPFSRLGPVTSRPSQVDRARARRLEPADHAHHRGLAAAGRADEHHELALGDAERERLDHFDRAAALVREPLRHVAELEKARVGRHVIASDAQAR